MSSSVCVRLESPKIQQGDDLSLLTKNQSLLNRDDDSKSQMATVKYMSKEASTCYVKVYIHVHFFGIRGREIFGSRKSFKGQLHQF